VAGVDRDDQPDRAGPTPALVGLERRCATVDGLSGRREVGVVTVVAELVERSVRVEPGAEATATVRLSNISSVVESYALEVVGDAARWSLVEPAEVTLFPGAETTATLRFRPPREPGVRPGRLPFGVKVRPLQDAAQSVVEEGVLVVAEYDQLGAELLPQRVVARRGGRFGVALDNRGNRPTTVEVQARDPAGVLIMIVRPKSLEVPPGTTRFVRVRVLPRQRYLSGAPKPHRFKVEVIPDRGPRRSLDGDFTQMGVLPGWALLALAAVGALALWFLLLRPAIRSTAKDAIAPATRTADQQAAALTQRLAATNSAVSGISKKISATTTTTAPPPTTTTTTSPPVTFPPIILTTPTTTTTTVPVTEVAVPFGQTLEAVAAPGTITSDAYSVASGDVLTVSQIVFQNANPVNGEAVLEIEPAGGAPAPLFFQSLHSLTEESIPLTEPLEVGPGARLVLSVTCGAEQGACDAGVYLGGQLIEPKS